MPAKVENQSTLKEPEKDLVVWTAPARPFKRRDRQFFVTLIAIASILGLILFLVEGFMPVVLIISIIFLYYIMSTVPPDNIEYKLTTKGVKIAENLTEWTNFTRYWFAKRYDSELLVFETVSIPGRMELVVAPQLKAQVTKALVPYVIFEEVPPSNIDKAANWFSKKLPQG